MRSSRRSFCPWTPRSAAAFAIYLVERTASDRTLSRVEDVAAIADLDVRALQRAFRTYVGVSPKWILRRYRLHEAAEQLKGMRPPALAALAASLDYADQSHFARDFKRVVGQTPRSFARDWAPRATRAHRSLLGQQPGVRPPGHARRWTCGYGLCTIPRTEQRQPHAGVNGMPHVRVRTRGHELWILFDRYGQAPIAPQACPSPKMAAPIPITLQRNPQHSPRDTGQSRMQPNRPKESTEPGMRSKRRIARTIADRSPTSRHHDGGPLLLAPVAETTDGAGLDHARLAMLFMTGGG